MSDLASHIESDIKPDVSNIPVTVNNETTEVTHDAVNGEVKMESETETEETPMQIDPPIVKSNSTYLHSSF